MICSGRHNFVDNMAVTQLPAVDGIDSYNTTCTHRFQGMSEKEADWSQSHNRYCSVLDAQAPQRMDHASLRLNQNGFSSSKILVL